MPMTAVFLAYFGPEMQLPLTSLIGAVSGVLLIVGTRRSDGCGSGSRSAFSPRRRWNDDSS